MENKSLSAAEQVLIDLQKNYLEDLPFRFDEIERIILLLENSSTLGEEFVELLRVVHSLKGSAGTYSFSVVSRICHLMEDTLKHIADNHGALTDAFISAWLSYVDLMRKTQQLLLEGESDFEEVLSLAQEIDANLYSDDIRCLIIDPSRFASLIYQKSLSDLPMRFTVESDGIRALERLVTERWDVLITSMEVPLLNGPTIIAVCRLSAGLNEKLKTVLVTSKSNLELSDIQKPDCVVKRGAGLADDLQQSVKKLLGKAI